MKVDRYYSSYSLADFLRCVTVEKFKIKIQKDFSDVKGVQPIRKLIYYESASSALYNFLCKHGEESLVALPAYTCIEVVHAIRSAGCKPVFIDVSKKTGLIDLDKLNEEIKLNKLKIKYVVATHLFGIPCDISSIKRLAEIYGLYIIEDCAQAMGSFSDSIEVGDWGDVSIFSTGRGKNIDLGGGGYLKVNNPIFDTFKDTEISNEISLKSLCRSLLLSREIFGYIFPYLINIKGFMLGTWFWGNGKKRRTYRADKMDMMLIRKVLAGNIDMHAIRAKRVMLAEGYSKGLKNIFSGIELIVDKVNSNYFYSAYPLLVSNREALFQHLRKFGYDCPIPFCYSAAEDVANQLEFPGADEFCKNIFLLPIHDGVTNDDIERICNLMINHYAKC